MTDPAGILVIEGRIPAGQYERGLTTTIAEFTTRLIGGKRRRRAYKARTRQLPATYRTAGPWRPEIPVREIVGDNPVGFVKGLVQSDSTIRGMSARERERLISTIGRDPRRSSAVQTVAREDSAPAAVDRHALLLLIRGTSGQSGDQLAQLKWVSPSGGEGDSSASASVYGAALPAS